MSWVSAIFSYSLWVRFWVIFSPQKWEFSQHLLSVKQLDLQCNSEWYQNIKFCSAIWKKIYVTSLSWNLTKKSLQHNLKQNLCNGITKNISMILTGTCDRHTFQYHEPSPSCYIHGTVPLTQKTDNSIQVNSKYHVPWQWNLHNEIYTDWRTEPVIGNQLLDVNFLCINCFYQLQVSDTGHTALPLVQCCHSSFIHTDTNWLL